MYCLKCEDPLPIDFGVDTGTSLCDNCLNDEMEAHGVNVIAEIDTRDDVAIRVNRVTENVTVVLDQVDPVVKLTGPKKRVEATLKMALMLLADEDMPCQ